MRISYKIIVLVVFLLCVLGANTLIGLKHIANIRSELFAVANEDVALLEDVSAIYRLQLEKAVSVQQLIGIAEEIGFEGINPVRKGYLVDQLTGMGKVFIRYNDEISLRIQVAKGHLDRESSAQGDVAKRQELAHSLGIIHGIESDLGQYDLLITGMLRAMHAGGFQLSLEDLDRLRSKNGAITANLRDLLKEVEGSTHASMKKTDHWQREAKGLLWVSLALSVVVALFLLIWTMASIAEINALNVRLKAANGELDNFIQVVGKDIVNPLTGMIAYCAYLEGHAGKTMDEKNLEALSGIRRSCTKTQVIAKDLLEFSQKRRLKT